MTFFLLKTYVTYKLHFRMVVLLKNSSTFFPSLRSSSTLSNVVGYAITLSLVVVVNICIVASDGICTFYLLQTILIKIHQSKHNQLQFLSEGNKNTILFRDQGCLQITMVIRNPLVIDLFSLRIFFLNCIPITCLNILINNQTILF